MDTSNITYTDSPEGRYTWMWHHTTSTKPGEWIMVKFTPWNDLDTGKKGTA